MNGDVKLLPRELSFILRVHQVSYFSQSLWWKHSLHEHILALLTTYKEASFTDAVKELVILALLLLSDESDVLCYLLTLRISAPRR